MAVRPGTGKVVKFFKLSGETTASLAKEVDALTDADLAQLVKGIEDGSLTY